MNTEEVKKLNDNLKKNLKNSKKIKEKENEKIKEQNEKSIKKNQCDKCFLQFDDYSSLEKHKWKKHPVDEFQYKHSQINNWDNYSLAYRDDPYY